jgi:hypothetical protein
LEKSWEKHNSGKHYLHMHLPHVMGFAELPEGILSLDLSKIAKGTAVGVASGLLIALGTIKNVSTHSGTMFLNFYPNGTVDFSIEVTSIVKSALALALVVFSVGLLLGTFIMQHRQRDSEHPDVSRQEKVIWILEKARAPAELCDWNAHELLEYANLLDKSGFLRKVITEGKVSYELTNLGSLFLGEYEGLSRSQVRLEQKTH